MACGQLRDRFIRCALRDQIDRTAKSAGDRSGRKRHTAQECAWAFQNLDAFDVVGLKPPVRAGVPPPPSPGTGRADEPARVTRRNRVVGIMVSAEDYQAMRVFYANRLRQTLRQSVEEAAAKGSTDEKLEQLLADEDRTRCHRHQRPDRRCSHAPESLTAGRASPRCSRSVRPS